MLLNFKGTALALLLAGSAGFGQAEIWERRPHVDIALPLFLWHVHFRLPDGLLAQRDAAVAAQAATGRSVLACRGSLAAQSATVAHQAALGTAAVAAGSQQLASRAANDADLRQRAGRLTMSTSTVTATTTPICAVWGSTDAAVVEAFK